MTAPEWLTDWFAPAQFDELDDTSRLAAPSYELMTAGVRFGDDGVGVTAGLATGVHVGDACAGAVDLARRHDRVRRRSPARPESLRVAARVRSVDGPRLSVAPTRVRAASASSTASGVSARRPVQRCGRGAWARPAGRTALRGIWTEARRERARVPALSAPRPVPPAHGARQHRAAGSMRPPSPRASTSPARRWSRTCRCSRRTASPRSRRTRSCAATRRPAHATPRPTTFPLVEFRAPDLPWRYTPARAGTNARLRPWLALAVVEEDADGIAYTALGSAGRLTVTPGQLHQLPPAGELWGWAHVQSAEAAAAIATTVDTAPDAVRSRICARVVSRPAPPTARRSSARSRPAPASAASRRGTTHGRGRRARRLRHLDVHDGRRGRRLRGALRAAGAGAARSATVGVRQVDVSTSGLDVAWPSTPMLIDVVGALADPGVVTQREPRGTKAFAAAAVPILERRARPRRTTCAGSPPTTTRSPTTRWSACRSTQAGRRQSEACRTPAGRASSTSGPIRRIAAGLGAEVVRRAQEALMAAAWDELGNVREAADELNRGRLAAEIGRSWQPRLAAFRPATASGLPPRCSRSWLSRAHRRDSSDPQRRRADGAPRPRLAAPLPARRGAPLRRARTCERRAPARPAPSSTRSPSSGSRLPQGIYAVEDAARSPPSDPPDPARAGPARLRRADQPRRRSSAVTQLAAFVRAIGRPPTPSSRPDRARHRTPRRRPPPPTSPTAVAGLDPLAADARRRSSRASRRSRHCCPPASCPRR